ncbi:hypothetical protein ACFLZ6_01350, partial [Nanoarchaeota archaeon]
GDDGASEPPLPIDDEHLCRYIPADDYEWQIADIRQGKIYENYTSNGTLWMGCGTSWDEPLNMTSSVCGSVEHQYLCSNEEIAECCGNLATSCCHSNNDAGGLNKNTGEDFAGMYCTSEFTWVDNADSSETACDAIVGPGNWTGSKCCEPGETYSDIIGPETCVNGEVVDEGIVAANEQLLNLEGQLYGCGSDPLGGEIIVVDACNITQGYYCAIVDSKWKEISEWPPQSEAQETPTDLDPKSWPEGDSSDACCMPTQCWNDNEVLCIDDQSEKQPPNEGADPYDGQRCVNGEWKQAVLKYDWQPEDLEDDDHIGYCPEISQCLYLNTGEPYIANFKGYGGYTLEEDFDYVCVDGGSYDEYDNYCNNGFWTTRTRLVAQKMLAFAEANSPNDFTLFCGRDVGVCGGEKGPCCADTASCKATGGTYEPKSILTHIDYDLTPFLGDWEVDDSGTIGYIGDYITFYDAFQDRLDDVGAYYSNNFCVLSTPTQVLFGTSINRDEDDGLRFIEVFARNPSDCDLTTDEYAAECGQTSLCDICDDGRIWFDNRTAILFYSDYPLSETTDTPNLFNENANHFNNFASDMQDGVNWIVNDISIAPDDPELIPDYLYVDLTRRFDQLYIRNKDSIIIQGILEEAGTERPYFLVNYKGLGLDVCTLVESYDDIISPPQHIQYTGDYLHCKDDAGGQWVVGGYDRPFVMYPWYGVYPPYYDAYLNNWGYARWQSIDIWADLTAKLRIE